jgi:serine/threonine protein kinase
MSKQALRTQFPTLFAVHERFALCHPDVIQNIQSLWEQAGISQEDWVAAYYSSQPGACMRLNHMSGYGCSLGSECTYKHTCLLCGKPGHGVWQMDSQGLQKCTVHRNYLFEMQKCELTEPEIRTIVGQGEAFSHQARARVEGEVAQDFPPLPPTSPAAHPLQQSEVMPTTMPGSGGGEEKTEGSSDLQEHKLEEDGPDFAPSATFREGLSSPTTTAPSATDSDDSDDSDDDSDEEPEPLHLRILEKSGEYTGVSSVVEFTIHTDFLICMTGDSSVYEANYISHILGTEDVRKVVVKLIAVPFHGEEKKRRRKQLKAELLSLKRLKEETDNVVAVLDSTEVQIGFQTYYCIVMERCDHNLAEWTMTVPQESGSLLSKMPLVLQSFVRQLLNGYLVCHSHDVCHRDVKPTNILVSKDKMTGRLKLKLCDFGHSKQLNKEGSTMTTKQGTIDKYGCWYPPEVLEADVYHRDADLWPLGCMLHFLGTDGSAPLFKEGNDVMGLKSQRAVIDALGDPELLAQRLRAGDLHKTHPLLHNLVQKLVRPVRDRWPLKKVICHPFLWDKPACKEQITFFSNALMENSKGFGGQATHVPSALVCKFAGLLEKYSNESNFRWADQLKDNMQKIVDANAAHCASLMQGPNGAKLKCLLRLVRNVLEHFSAVLKQDPTKSFETATDRIVDAVTESFPWLLPTLFEASCECGMWTADSNGYRFEWGASWE